MKAELFKRAKYNILSETTLCTSIELTKTKCEPLSKRQNFGTASSLLLSLVISFIQTKLAILKWTSGATNHKIK